MAQLVRANAREITGIDPTPIVSLGGTDARLWRYKDIRGSSMAHHRPAWAASTSM
jgi:hypothetical protein